MAGFKGLFCKHRADDQHCPRTSLVCIESSHNRCGGCALSLEYMRSLKSWADDMVRLPDLPCHLPPTHCLLSAAHSADSAAWHSKQPGCQRCSHRCRGTRLSWLVLHGEAVLIEECCMLKAAHGVCVGPARSPGWRAGVQCRRRPGGGRHSNHGAGDLCAVLPVQGGASAQSISHPCRPTYTS